MAEPPERQSGLRVASALARLAIELFGPRILAAQPADIGFLVVRRRRALVADRAHRPLARHLRLADNLSGPVHHAHAAQFQRHVDCGKILHGCPSSMLGADTIGPRSHHHCAGQPPTPVAVTLGGPITASRCRPPDRCADAVRQHSAKTEGPAKPFSARIGSWFGISCSATMRGR